MNPSASSNARWKVHDLQALVNIEQEKNHSIPFIALTETWLKSYIKDAQLHIPDYVVSRSDRNKRVGGGVALYSHQNIPVSGYATFDDGICQVLFSRFDTLKTCVAVVYRPPNTPAASFSSVIDFLNCEINDVSDETYQLHLTGDFNFPCVDWESCSTTSGGSSDDRSSAESLFRFMSDHLLNQYVLSSTRGSNVLDLFFTNNDRLVTNVSSLSTDLSDHNLVDIMISSNPLGPDQLHSPQLEFDQNSFRSIDFHNANFDEVRQRLKDVDWDMLRELCTSEEFPVLFTYTLYQICQASIPQKKVGTGKPKALNALRRRKKRLNARYNAILEHGNAEHAKNIQNKLALVCYEMKEAINKNLDMKELRAVQKIKSNPKFFYSYAKSKSNVKSNINMLFNSREEVVTGKEDMANILQDQFNSVFSDPDSPHVKSPDFEPPSISKPFEDYEVDVTNADIISAISDIKSDSACGPDGVPAVLLKNCADELCEPIKLIWSESFHTGIVPEFYKQSYVTPLYKKGDRARALNYRPVSLTSHVIKVYERVLRKIMVAYLEDNNILCHNQHGFRSGRSCLTQMLSHFDDVLLGLTNNKDTDAIYLDYAKAFDKVDHRLLLAKLHRYGFSSQMISWVKSFLTNRPQNVVLDGQHSYSAAILSGVPQGTVLGPILFILFINDMDKCVKHSSVRFFADDTRVSKHISSEADTAQLQEDLNNIIEWSTNNNMMLHEDKFDLMVHLHRPRFELYQLPFVCEQMTYTVSTGDILYPVQELKDLGVIVSSDLSWRKHINAIVSRAKAVAAWVFSVFKTRDTLTMLTLYKSVVRSHLEYCCILWNPSSLTDIQLLESVQRTFTSRIWGVQHLNYWERLRALGLMSLQRRRERYIIIQMWKILYARCPNDLNVQFSAPSRQGTRAKVPTLSKSSSQHHQTLYDHSFAVLGPRLWNTLPSHLPEIADLETFKHNLTKFLLTFSDNPPVPGYKCANDNSILQWCKNKAGATLLGRSQNTMTQ